MNRVGIVICNYNKRVMVIDCIEAVLAQTYRNYDLYVVDNASLDDSVEAIREKYTKEQLTLIRNYENLGGSGGFNTGLRRAITDGHEYLMCVDNDCILDKDALKYLVDFLDNNAECGIAASKIYHLEKPEYVQNFGQIIDFEHFATEANYLGEHEEGQMPDVMYSDAVPACALLIRKSVTDIIGLLPEENFLYWDDTEWCYKANLNGFKVASVGVSKAYHAMGAKKEDVNTFPTYYAWRNWIRFFIKYTPQDKWIDMALYFLSSIFETEYWGWYNDVYAKANTVMAAYDDAIHGVTGKAGSDKIFELDFPEGEYKEPYDEVKEEFDKARELFIYSQLPLFLRQVEILRDSEGIITDR